MPTNAKAKFPAMLPSTPCTAEMRDQIMEIVKQRNSSIAEVQRDAFSLFLAANYSNAIVKNSDNEIQLESRGIP